MKVIKLIQDQELLTDTGSWQRKIINGYWIVVALSFIAELVALVIIVNGDGYNVQEYVVYTMIIPTTLQLIIVTINEVLERYYHRYRPYFIILSGVLVSAVLIYGNKTVIGIQYVMMIPMLVAAFQFNRRHLAFAYTTVLATLALLYLCFPLIWNSMTIFERFAFFFILTGEFLVLLQLLYRSTEMLEKLIKTSRSERDLLIKNIVMEQISKMDPLTNLYNHRTFQEYLDYMIEQSEKHNMSLYLAVADIDNFKTINDTYGHAIGDVVLKKVAETLKDTFTTDEVIARYGGEEFAILLPTKNEVQAYELCETVRIALNKQQFEEMPGRKVSVSIGLAKYEAGMGKSTFFGLADSLLYEAKKTGKNKTIIAN